MHTDTDTDTDTGIFHLGSTHLQELEVRHGAVVNNRVEKEKKQEYLQ